MINEFNKLGFNIRFASLTSKDNINNIINHLSKIEKIDFDFFNKSLISQKNNDTEECLFNSFILYRIEKEDFNFTKLRHYILFFRENSIGTSELFTALFNRYIISCPQTMFLENLTDFINIIENSICNKSEQLDLVQKIKNKINENTKDNELSVAFSELKCKSKLRERKFSIKTI